MAFGLKATTVSIVVAGLLFSATCSHAQSDTHEHPSAASEHGSSFEIPKPMQTEHEALHSDLEIDKRRRSDRRGGPKGGKRSRPSLLKGEPICIPSLGLACARLQRKLRLRNDRRPVDDRQA
jgi:hypothetical protein